MTDQRDPVAENALIEQRLAEWIERAHGWEEASHRNSRRAETAERRLKEAREALVFIEQDVSDHKAVAHRARAALARLDESELA